MRFGEYEDFQSDSKTKISDVCLYCDSPPDESGKEAFGWVVHRPKL